MPCTIQVCTNSRRPAFCWKWTQRSVLLLLLLLLLLHDYALWVVIRVPCLPHDYALWVVIRVPGLPHDYALWVVIREPGLPHDYALWVVIRVIGLTHDYTLCGLWSKYQAYHMISLCGLWSMIKKKIVPECKINYWFSNGDFKIVLIFNRFTFEFYFKNTIKILYKIFWVFLIQFLTSMKLYYMTVIILKHESVIFEPHYVRLCHYYTYTILYITSSYEYKLCNYYTYTLLFIMRSYEYKSCNYYTYTILYIMRSYEYILLNGAK